MGSKIKCFWVEATDKVMQSLRRFTWYKLDDPTACQHEASVEIGVCNVGEAAKMYSGRPVHGDLWTHGDTRWPTACAKCGYVFQPEDEWQYNPDILYRNVETGDEFTDKQAPPGAMRHNEGMRDFATYGPDDIILEVKLPDGVWWCVDGPANNGTPDAPGWKRSGDKPNFTARPSIATPGYHGFLTNGYLDEC